MAGLENLTTRSDHVNSAQRGVRHSPDHPRGRPRKAYHMIPGCQTRSSSSGIPTRITAGRAPGEHHPPWTCHSRHESADSVFFTPPPGHPVGVLSTRWNSTHESHRTQNQGRHPASGHEGGPRSPQNPAENGARCSSRGRFLRRRRPSCPRSLFATHGGHRWSAAAVSPPPGPHPPCSSCPGAPAGAGRRGRRLG